MPRTSRKNAFPQTPETPDDRAAKIRELFLEPKERYTFAEAERLTGLPAEALRRVCKEMNGAAYSSSR